MACDDAARLVGTWDLLSYRVTLADGQVIEPLGPRPRGTGIYTAQGTVAAQLMRTGRPRLGVVRSIDGLDLEPRLLAQAFTGYIAYSGRYVVDADSAIVDHHVECGLVPDWEGTTLRRAYVFEDDLLVLRPWPAEGRHAELRWRRRTG
ncbi:lipocalin-like domain-containing protein [Variovorax sp.]|jgi:hypothetical protein|uniref:lipocalin-like domain-containing protein n=1 Tax=Variovorax sp. TaxID=1871043 RepID=UPI0037DA64A8